jgi:hypothetical protein
MKRLFSSLLLVALFALMLLGAVGCASTDPEGWENGIPTGMYQNH